MSTASTPSSPVISDDEVVEISRDVWSSFLNAELEPVQLPPDAADDERMTGFVRVTGAWQGTVLIESSRAVALAAAAAMFDMAESELSCEEIVDAWGELANMIGGNLKCLVPSPSQLSIPLVAAGGISEDDDLLAGTVRQNHVAFSWDGRPLWLGVWSALPDRKLRRCDDQAQMRPPR